MNLGEIPWSKSIERASKEYLRFLIELIKFLKIDLNHNGLDPILKAEMYLSEEIGFTDYNGFVEVFVQRLEQLGGAENPFDPSSIKSRLAIYLLSAKHDNHIELEEDTSWFYENLEELPECDINIAFDYLDNYFK
ncbi:MAG: hypothetical protein ACI9SP_002626 [Arenicella sp.]|jgi:hypothetical protein